MTFPRGRLFWAVSLGHLTVDIFNGSVAVTLTFLSGHLLSLTNTQMGAAISAYQMAAAVSQPLCGWIADRSGGRWLGAGGVAWTVSLISLSLIVAVTTRSFGLMVIPLVLAAFGSGAFHPVGTMHAAESDSLRSTGNLSVFFLMGQFGGGFGPAIAGFLLDQTATHNDVFTAGLGPSFSGRLIEHGSVVPLLIFALAAIPSVLLMLVAIPNAHAHKLRPAALAQAAPKQALRIAPLLLLAAIIMLRGLINPGLVAFLPRLFQARGWSASEYGLVTTMYWIGSGITGVIFGNLADRYGSRLLIVVSMLLAAPAVFGLGVFGGSVSFLLALAAGAFSGGSHSLIVAMTQKLMPSGKGFASGASLGFIFAMGALGVLVIGALADRLGLDAAFQIVSIAGFATALLALLLPADRPQAHPTPAQIEDSPAASRP